MPHSGSMAIIGCTDVRKDYFPAKFIVWRNLAAAFSFSTRHNAGNADCGLKNPGCVYPSGVLFPAPSSQKPKPRDCLARARQFTVSFFDWMEYWFHRKCRSHLWPPLNLFSHPDYTVGPGISPDRPHMRFADCTAGRESHPAPKNLFDQMNHNIK